MCSNCSCAEESIVHAIFNCSRVRGIWMESSFHELIVEAPTSSFGELLLWVSERIQRNEYVNDYESYVAKVIHRAKVVTMCSASGWTRPPTMVWKVNTDAAIMEGGGMGLGVVVRGSNGQLIEVAVQRVKARWSANVAEVVVAWYGMQLVRGLEARKVWLESDALSVVTAVNGHGHGRSPVFMFLNKILALANDCDVFQCSHVG
ncbi:Tetraacyldisaccharide 4'-kinase [Bienertia sinuspersici]